MFVKQRYAAQIDFAEAEDGVLDLHIARGIESLPEFSLDRLRLFENYDL